MKRFFAILLMAVLVISALQVFAEEDTAAVVADSNETGAEDSAQDAEVLTASDGSVEAVLVSDGTAVAAPVKIRDKVMENKQLQIDKMTQLTEEQKAKFMELKQEQIEKLSALKAEGIEKFAALKQEQIEKFTNLRQEQLEKFVALKEEQIEKLALMTRARLKEFSSLSKEKLNEKLAELKLRNVSKADLYKKRTVKDSDAKAARERYNDAEDKYVKAKEDFMKEKELFEKWKNVNDTKAVEAAKKFLTHAGEMIIRDLEKVKAKAQENNDLTEDELNKIVSDADAKIAEIKDAMAKVDAATTKEEIKGAGAAMLKSWKDAREHIRLHVGEMVNSKVGEIIQRSEQLETKLEKILSEMKQQGVEVTDIDAKLNSFSEKIEAARAKFDEAKALLKEVRDLKGTSGTMTDDMKAKADKAHELAKEAHGSLKEANQILIDIWKEVKQSKANVKIEDENENASVQVIEEAAPQEAEETEATDAEEQETVEAADEVAEEEPAGSTETTEDSASENTTEDSAEETQ
jgi:hypothetical protein